VFRGSAKAHTVKLKPAEGRSSGRKQYFERTASRTTALSTNAQTMGNAYSLPHEDGEELSTPPPPPPGAVLIQDREYGALGLAKIRTFGNTLTFNTIPTHTIQVCFVTCTVQDEEVGIEQLLKDLWSDAWLAIQPVLEQVNELTTDAWYGSSTDCCFSNTAIKYRGVSHVHQLLTASAWIIKLNEVLNPHGLAADLYEKSTYHITMNSKGPDGRNQGPSGETKIDLYLRLYLWSARAAQAAPQPMQVEVPPGQMIAAGGHSIAVMGPDGQQCQTIVPPGLMPAQFFVFHVPARAATAPPTQTMQLAVPSGVVPVPETIAALTPDGKQYTIAVPDGVGLGQSFQFKLPPDAAWWRTVEPPQAAPAHQVMVRPVLALYSQPRLSQWSVGYA
jgi:hypothetical protein